MVEDQQNELTIVDTDILIDAGRGVIDAVSSLKRIQEISVLAISSVSKMEMIVGCRTKNELRLLERFLKRFRTIHLNEHISHLALELLAQYRLSHGLLIPDALIASTSLSISSAFMTKNLRHYRFIDELCLLPYPAL